MRPVVTSVALLLLTGCASGGGARDERTRPVRALPPDAAPPTPVDNMPSGFRAAFADTDTRARAIVYHQQCAATVLRLRASGRFGAAATAPRAVYCERTVDGVPIGGVFDIDSAFTRARRLTLVRLDGERPRFAEVIDTARIVQQARLVRDITRNVTPAWRKLARPFSVVPLAQTDGTLEGWVVPLPTRVRSAVLGGDLCLRRAADGTLTRIVDRSATWKQVPIPPSGPVRLPSVEASVAAVEDLVVARGLAEIGREVAVVTTSARSTLVPERDSASGSRFSWQHSRATP